jgi:rare lipoprotein A
MSLKNLNLSAVEEGVCSWYGAQGEIPEGWPTACGNQFSRNAMTAAHKTLPCGTKVRVTNLKNGQSIEVIVNDRGPFVAGRILDLTYGAAAQMNFIDQGLINCRIESL